MPYTSPTDSTKSKDTFWFSATILFMIIEFGRPQDVLPLGFLRPGLILTLILIIFLLTKKKEQAVHGSQAKWIIYFILLITAYVPIAVNNHYAYLIARYMWLQVPFLFACLILINTKKRLTTFLIWLVGIMIYLSIYSLFHNGQGPGGVVRDENDLTLFIVIVLPFAFVLLIDIKSSFYRCILFIGIIISLLAIVTAFSRGGFVGLIAAACVAWLFSSKKVLFLIIILFMAGIIYIFGGESYQREMSTITDTKENTARERILSWQAGWRMFLDNPLGVGGGNFPVRFPQYQSEEFQRGMWGRVAHSLWFTLLPELGIIGTWIYFSIIFQNLRDISFMKKIKLPEKDASPIFFNNLAIAFYTSLAGFFASATFLSVLYYPQFWLLTSLIAASKFTAMGRIENYQQ